MQRMFRAGWLVALVTLLAACQTSTAEKAPVTRVIDGGITHVSRTVKVASGANVEVDIYLPASPAPAPAPGVFVLPTYYVNVNGRSELPDRVYAFELARQGYATIVPALTQYGPRAYHPGHSADMLSLSVWFKGLPEVMDDRIAAVGFSAGCHHAGVLAIADPATRAIIGYYGSHDTARYARLAEDGQTAPLRHAPKINGRVLILHGAADNETPVEDALVYRDALVAAGKPVELVVYPGVYHRYERGPSDTMQGRDTNRAGYIYRLNPAARDDSWRRTLDLLERTMR
jgi:dienelactone hydrolase